MCGILQFKERYWMLIGTQRKSFFWKEFVTGLVVVTLNVIEIVYCMNMDKN